MTRNKNLIVFFPLSYSCLLSLAIFTQVNLFILKLTSEAKELLVQTPLQFLTSTFFLLIPNILLSFFLFGYAKAHPKEEKNLLVLCLISLFVATLMSCSIWTFFYTALPKVPVIVFGFPVTYFFGICIGYIVSVLAIGAAIPVGSETSESEMVKIVSFVDSGLNLTDSEPVLVVGSSPATLEETLESSPFCEELESKFPAEIAAIGLKR